MSLAWEEMHCLQCRLSLQPIWILELQSKYLFVVFYLESGSWAPVGRQPFPFSLSQTKAFGCIAACLIYHQSAQENEHDCWCKVFKVPNICCSTLLTQGCCGSHWWGISAGIRDLVVGPMEMFTLGFHFTQSMLWNGQMQQFPVEILKYWTHRAGFHSSECRGAVGRVWAAALA